MKSRGGNTGLLIWEGGIARLGMGLAGILCRTEESILAGRRSMKKGREWVCMAEVEEVCLGMDPPGHGAGAVAGRARDHGLDDNVA